ncbi:thiamine ABC transporter substrate-binding protein [Psittacicella gerlachiana]|uniref:Iron(III) transport system substrate-binding protein n=1 Tax=Psittacicella gerlachiana TaxID=2028574 RepID=A0A3A1YLI7_9GAMM|nr:thiamine ABC transporter substrate-binding protein [Psittacicella gerlachiana]RIY38421.1 hypothetical protein CKF59_00990 [Psittacicella gerlachiana]
MKLSSLSLVALGMLATSAFATNSDRPTLNILTYEVIKDYGVAQAISDLFEPQCGCKLNWFTDSSQFQMLNKYVLTANSKSAQAVDVIVGVDINSATLVKEKLQGLFRPINYQVETLNNFPFAATWDNQFAQPLSSSAVTVIYNSDKYTPTRQFKDFPDLIEHMDFSFIFGDPRSNDLGRTLNKIIAYYATNQEQRIALWQKIKAKTVTVGKGWSSSYGVFAKGESQAALGYSSSVIYHTLVENKPNLQPLLQGAKLPFLVDSVLLTKNTKQAALADQFAAFLLTPEAQKLFFKYNSSYPVINIDAVLSPTERAVAAGINNYQVLDLRNLDPQAEKDALDAYVKVFVQN